MVPDSMRLPGNAFASNADGTLTVIHPDAPKTDMHRGNRADTAGLTQHGARRYESPCVHRLGEVWAGAFQWKGQRAGAARIFRIDDDRARSRNALTPKTCRWVPILPSTKGFGPDSRDLRPLPAMNYYGER